MGLIDGRSLMEIVLWMCFFKMEFDVSLMDMLMWNLMDVAVFQSFL